MADLTLLVMAAGMGSRYGGNKQIDHMGPDGEILMEYSIYDAVEAGFDKVVFVIKRDMEEIFRASVGDKIAKKVAVAYAYQEYSNLPDGFTPPPERVKPYGTVHAVACAKPVISGPFAVINADDYYGKDGFKLIAKALKELAPTGEACMVGYRLKNTVSENGSVTRGVCTVDGQGMLQSVTETYKIMPVADGTIRDFARDDKGVVLDPEALVSMNFWGFTPAILDECESGLRAFLKQSGNELKSEYVLPVMIDTLMHKGLTVRVLPTNAEWFGVTYREDKPYVQQRLLEMHQKGLYPEKL